MVTMTINLDGDGAWPDLAAASFIHVKSPIQVAVLDGGMSGGRPSVSLRFDLPDGQIVVAETSARLFVTASRAIEARYPDLFEGE